MILKDNTIGELEVKFSPGDWSSGAARKAIATLKKDFPSVYIAASKKWVVKKSKAEECRETLRALEKDHTDLYNQYTITEFLKQFEDKVNESEESETNEDPLQ